MTTKLESLKAEASGLDAWIEELEERSSGLAKELGPFWREYARIRNALARTHITVDDDDGCPLVIGWIRFDRSMMFNSMDSLNDAYTAPKIEHAEIKRRIKACVRARRKIGELIEREERKISNKLQMELL